MIRRVMSMRVSPEQRERRLKPRNTASGLSCGDMRRELQQLQLDTSLSTSERAQAMQRLMTRSWRESSENLLKSAEDESQAVLECFHDKENNVLGCEHYRRGCKLKAPCCGKFYVCRFCHDETSTCGTKFDRQKVEELQCMRCGKVQGLGEQCVDCGQRFARYACLKCRLFDDDPDKKIYHCDDCGLCRIGEGLGIDYFHCHDCNACMSVDLRYNHKCIKGSLSGNCPICTTPMFESTDPVTFLPCGHCMHVKCYKAYTMTNYTCPLCSKSLGDMSGYFQRLDELIASQPMPKEYENCRSKIWCADCEERSDVKMHFLYHKCQNCSSYNTKVLSQTMAGAEQEQRPAPMEVDCM